MTEHCLNLQLYLRYSWTFQLDDRCSGLWVWDAVGWVGGRASYCVLGAGVGRRRCARGRPPWLCCVQPGAFRFVLMFLYFRCILAVCACVVCMLPVYSVIKNNNNIYYHKRTISLYEFFGSVSGAHHIGCKIKLNYLVLPKLIQACSKCINSASCSKCLQCLQRKMLLYVIMKRMILQFIVVASGVSSFIERKIRWYCCIIYIMGNFWKLQSYHPVSACILE